MKPNKGIPEDQRRYTIVRFSMHVNGQDRIIKERLTLAEARAWCSRPDTHGVGWFDGYKEDKR